MGGKAIRQDGKPDTWNKTERENPPNYAETLNPPQSDLRMDGKHACTTANT